MTAAANLFNGATTRNARQWIFHHPDDTHLVPEELPEPRKGDRSPWRTCRILRKTTVRVTLGRVSTQKGRHQTQPADMHSLLKRPIPDSDCRCSCYAVKGAARHFVMGRRSVQRFTLRVCFSRSRTTTSPSARVNGMCMSARRSRRAIWRGRSPSPCGTQPRACRVPARRLRTCCGYRSTSRSGGPNGSASSWPAWKPSPTRSALSSRCRPHRSSALRPPSVRGGRHRGGRGHRDPGLRTDGHRAHAGGRRGGRFLAPVARNAHFRPDSSR